MKHTRIGANMCAYGNALMCVKYDDAPFVTASYATYVNLLTPLSWRCLVCTCCDNRKCNGSSRRPRNERYMCATTKGCDRWNTAWPFTSKCVFLWYSLYTFTLFLCLNMELGRIENWNISRNSTEWKGFGFLSRLFLSSQFFKERLR